MRAHTRSRTGLLLILITLLPGCFIEVDDGPGPVRRSGRAEPIDRGTLVIEWTIDRRIDPYDCRLHGAVTIDIVVETLGGERVGAYQQDCEAFATSIHLWPDDYVAFAVLLDRDGYERTTVVHVDPFSIYGGDELLVPIDFPLRSFY